MCKDIKEADAKWIITVECPYCYTKNNLYDVRVHRPDKVKLICESERCSKMFLVNVPQK